jgi:hypothetical protein
MNTKLKAYAVLVLVLAFAAGEGATQVNAPQSGPSKSTSRHVRLKSREPSVASQIEALRRDMESQRQAMESQQGQIETLRQQLSQRDAQLEQAQQTVTAAETAVEQRQQQQLSTNAQQVANLQSAVTDLHTSIGAVASTVQEEQTRAVKRSELADLAFGKIKIGTLFYGDWAYYTDTGFGPQFLTQLDQLGPGNNGFNTFDITRAYINIFYTPDEAVTLRVTPNVYRQVDVSAAMPAGTGAVIPSSSNGNLGYRLKYAYAQLNTLFKKSDAFKHDYLRMGQQVEPLVDWEEGLYYYRYVNLVPWNYLSLSSTYVGVAAGGPIEFHGKEYLDYQIGAFNTASFHAIETRDKKQGMARLTWYPFGTTTDRTGFGITGFEDYGYSTAPPDSNGVALNRVAALVHYQSHSEAYLIAGEYDLGRNAFSTGNLYSGAGPADAFGLGPTSYATFSSLASALLAGEHTRQQGFAVFGHAKLGHSPFTAFGMYEYFQPNTRISGTNPLDFERTVGGFAYKINEHFEVAFDDQNLNYFHNQFTMSAAQIATFSPSLAAANPNGIPNVVPNGTNAFFTNLQFRY